MFGFRHWRGFARVLTGLRVSKCPLLRYSCTLSSVNKRTEVRSLTSHPIARENTLSSLTHFDADGHPRMIDISEKTATCRTAVASCMVEMAAETLILIKNDQIQKGNVFEVARIAAIMASKRTPDLIPMCHPIRVDSVDVRITEVSDTRIKITGTVKAVETTGTEMEAITAVSVGAMAVYDMCKSVDRGMKILQIQLEEKSGGKSGHFLRQAESE